MKIHVILNSHLDPVWLWNAAQGIDEVISTAESNCEVLEDYPEAIITRGEAWFYEILAEKSKTNLSSSGQTLIANITSPRSYVWLKIPKK